MSDTLTLGHARVVADTSTVDRGDWLTMRRQGLGGSDISAIVGLSPYRTPLSVWLEKTGTYIADDDPSEAMEWGNILEPVVADEFTRRSGIATERFPALLAHPDHEFMLANVDRVIPRDPFGVDVAGVYEGKTTNPYARKEWGTDDVPLVPDHAALQTHHYLMVTGLPFAYVAVLIGGQQLVWRRVDRDEEIIARLEVLESEFWARVVNGDPPPPMEQDAALLGDVWTPSPDASVVLTDDVINALARREVAKQAERAAKQAAAEAQAVIQLALGDSEYGLNESGDVVCSWKQVAESERKASVVAAHRRFVVKKQKESVNG